MKEVYVVADASRCNVKRVGAIAWAIIDGDQVIYNGRPVLTDHPIDKLELMAIREGLMDGKRIRRKYSRLATIAITDNVKALIDLKMSKASKGFEYLDKKLLKALPRRMRHVKEYHDQCDALCSLILEEARNECNVRS